jgi:hypothetical protein
MFAATEIYKTIPVGMPVIVYKESLPPVTPVAN